MDWQTIIVVIIIALAVGQLGRTVYKSFRPAKKGAGCNACKACGELSGKVIKD